MSRYASRRRLLVCVAVLTLAAISLTPIANAAIASANLTLASPEPGRLKIIGIHFPPGAVATTVATASHATGRRTDRVSADGSVNAGFSFNANYKGKITVTTTSGNAKASAVITVPAASIPLALYNDTTPAHGTRVNNISNGQTLDLTTLDKPNIWAFPGTNVRSMRFCLDNEPCRSELSPPFAMYDDEASTQWHPATGKHTLKALGYSTANATGTPIASTRITFVIGTSGATPMKITAPSPSTSIIPSSAKLQWKGDFDTGDTSQWDLETAESYSLTVANGGAGHPTAGRFEVRDGDTPVDSGERSEADAPDSIDVSEGDERWYSFSMMFDKSFPTPTSFCDPMQWHTANADGSAADGSPPINLLCKDDDKLYLEVGPNGEEKELLIGSLDKGIWHKYVIHVKFSQDPKGAFEEVTRDGQVVVPKTSPPAPNIVTPKMYLKIGMYRDNDNNGTMVVWHDDFAVYTP